jgi:endonuclease/exonuclease/phosphatase (EEP) superfamily protein YafD
MGRLVSRVREKWTSARRSVRENRFHAATLAATAITLVMVVLAGARLGWRDSNIIFIWLNAYTAWIYAPAYPVALFAAAFARWFLLPPALAICALHLWWVLPDYSGATPIPADAYSAPQLRLVTANVFHDNEELDEYVPALLAHQPDVLFLQEHGSETEQALEAAGIRDSLPHRTTALTPDFPFGLAIYSRYPLANVEVEFITRRPVIRADITVEGQPVRLINIHPVSPGSRWVINPWNEGWQQLVAMFKEQPLPFLVAGDFNMNQHHRWYGELNRIGLKSCHDERGRGTATTWPYGGGRLLYLLFPNIRIDHVFVSEGVVCMHVAEGDSPGSDHRPVIAELAIESP